MAGAGNPNMMANPMSGSVFQNAANATNMAGAAYANPNVNQFMNPYQQNVVDKTLRDVGNAAQMGMNTLDAQAQAAGAFGGSRHGIQGAEAMKGYQQQALDKVGQLNQQGYNTAMQNAFQQAAGLQGIGQQAFNMGQAITNQQMQQGTMQQQLMQNLLNQAKTQYGGYTGQPQQGLNTMLSTISAQPQVSGESDSYKPGIFDYIMAAGSF